MGRERKYRAWIISQKKMIDVFGFNEHLVFEQTFNSPCINENIYEIEDCVLRDYTGLKDKNGVDIYEGDVVNLSIEGFNLKPHLVPFLIVFNIDGFQGCNLLKKKSDFLNGTFFQQPRRFNYKEWKKLEVIGNVYENPKLL